MSNEIIYICNTIDAYLYCVVLLNAEEYMTESSIESSLTFTTPNGWDELEGMIQRGDIPRELGNCLKELIRATLAGFIPPRATPHLIELAKTHVPKGLVLKDLNSGDMKYYSIMVFDPNPDRKQNLYSLFLLVPRYPGGVLKRLEEF